MFLQTLKLLTFSVASNFLMAMSKVQNVPVTKTMTIRIRTVMFTMSPMTIMMPYLTYLRTPLKGLGWDVFLSEWNKVQIRNMYERLWRGWQNLSFQCPRYSGQPWEVPVGDPARGASSQLPSRPGHDYEYSHWWRRFYLYIFTMLHWRNYCAHCKKVEKSYVSMRFILQCLTEGIINLIIRK